MSKEVKYSKFYSAVEGSREWWKGHPYIIFKEVEYSKFYKGVKNGKKGIPI